LESISTPSSVCSDLSVRQIEPSTMLILVTTTSWLLTTFLTALRQSNNALKILLSLSAALLHSLKAYSFASTQTREIYKRERELIQMMYALVGCTFLFLFEVPRGPFYSPKGPRSRWNSIWKAILAFCRVAHRTVRCTTGHEQ
jgi:hypothetical protein